MTDQIVSLDRHPILMEQYEVCQAIEACGASPALTAAVAKAGAVLDRLKDIVLQIETLNAQTEYLTTCPSCGEGPSKTGFPRMDEDGLCACCGMDCSILGTVEALKEKEGWDTALEFYANSTNYDEFGVPRIPHEGHHGCKVPDLGRTAKLALHRA